MLCNMVEEIRVKCWEELNRELFKKNTLKNSGNRFRSTEVYRGLSDKRYKL